MPFHFWAPDTYEGAPTPVTAFLSVASKAGGFVALISIVCFGFFGRSGNVVAAGLCWVLAALSMTLGNLAALRQTNIVRMLAYSSIAQGGFMLVPFAAAGPRDADGGRRGAGRRVVIYLLIYGAMNLGAFAVRHRRGPADPHRRRSRRFAGFVRDAPGLGGDDDDLPVRPWPGIPPLAGWFAKFVMFRADHRRRHAAGGRRSA